MCGICGVYNYKDDENISRSLINKMTSSIVHRGPDDDGIYLSKNLGLGFRRLSIIDLSFNGHQPMSNKNKGVWVVFNGEIYNFKEIRNELEQSGYSFNSNSDTEVIVHGYEKWGEDVLNHLNGMFGLAIWDETKRKLILARDRMGIKMVYYSFSDKGIIFGSEVKAVTEVMHDSPDIDPDGLSLFLQYRYTPAPFTIYKGIRKLAAGEKLVLQEGAPPRKEVWWKYKPKVEYNKFKISDYEDKLIELYSNAMKRHLISDVPVGLLLSGGMDSAMLLALMNKHGADWPTFTIGYGEEYKNDELSDAARTAQMLGVRNYNLRLGQRDFEDSLPKVISMLEEPIASSSIVPMYHVCGLAKKYVTVAMVGQGPDELFGGYNRHLGIRYGAYWRKVPSFLRNPVKSFIGSISKSEKVMRSLYSIDQKNRMHRYKNTLSLLPPEEIDSLFKPGILSIEHSNNIDFAWSVFENRNSELGELGGFQFYEVRSTLPDELLMYADKLSMAHSLELRVPYLDTELVQWVETIPDNIKIRLFKTKYLHRRVCSKYLPAEILKRKKRGFAVDRVNDWFNSSLSGKLNEYITDPSSLLYSYMEYDKIQSMLRAHIEQKRDFHKILFSLVVFEEWLRNI